MRGLPGFWWVSVLSLGLGACSPPSAMPPPLPLASSQVGEVGASVVGGYGTGALGVAAALETDVQYQTLDGQVWFLVGQEDSVQFGLIGSLGTANFITFGAMTRLYLVKKPRFRLAAQLDGGFLWGRVVVPMAFKAVDRVWVWAAPGVMTSSNNIWDPDGETGPNLHLPVGVSRITASGHAYHLEAQLRTGTLEGERWYRASVAIGASLRPHRQDLPRASRTAPAPVPSQASLASHIQGQ